MCHTRNFTDLITVKVIHPCQKRVLLFTIYLKKPAPIIEQHYFFLSCMPYMTLTSLVMGVACRTDKIIKNGLNVFERVETYAIFET